jgi:citrate synthase
MVRLMEGVLKDLFQRPIPINIDGACAAVQCELGLPWQSAKGLFCLSRGVGLVAESLEEFLQGSRLKSPMPMKLWEEELLYEGPEERELPKEFKKE